MDKLPTRTFEKVFLSFQDKQHHVIKFYIGQQARAQRIIRGQQRIENR